MGELLSTNWHGGVGVQMYSPLEFKKNGMKAVIFTIHVYFYQLFNSVVFQLLAESIHDCLIRPIYV